MMWTLCLITTTCSLLLAYFYLHISILIFSCFWTIIFAIHTFLKSTAWFINAQTILIPTSIPSTPTRLCPLCLLCLPHPAAVWTAPTVVPLVHREARKLTHPVRPVATAAWHIRLQEVPTASAVSPPTTRASSLRMPTSTPNPPHPCPRTSPARYHSLTIRVLLLF